MRKQDLSACPILWLEIKFDIVKLLSDAGLMNVQDIIDYCNKYSRLIYIKGITLKYERMIVDVMKSHFDVDVLLPNLTCEEFLNIYYQGACDSWLDYQKSNRNYDALVYKRVEHLIHDVKITNCLHKSDIDTVGDLLVIDYMMRRYTCIKGIGSKSAKVIYNALNDIGLLMDFSLLDSCTREYLTRCIMAFGVECMFSRPKLKYDLYEKGFFEIGSIALYLERGHSIKDFNELMNEEFTSHELKIMKTLFSRLAIPNV